MGEGVVAEVRRAPRLHGSTSGLPAREIRRSGRSGVLQRRRIAAEKQLTGGGSWVEIRRSSGLTFD